MIILWTFLAAAAALLLSSWDEVLMTALDALHVRRNDDKPARRRIVTPSDAQPSAGARVSQPLSLFRRSRPRR